MEACQGLGDASRGLRIFFEGPRGVGALANAGPLCPCVKHPLLQNQQKEQISTKLYLYIYAYEVPSKITSIEFSIQRFIDIVKMHKAMANDRGLSKERYPGKRWKRWKTIGDSQTK